jgi:NADH-quinone oxidoreductase subunit N
VTAELVLPPILLGPLLPTLIVLAAGALVLILDLLPRRPSAELLAAVALAGVVGALLATLARWGKPGRAFHDMVVLDNFALFMGVVICYAAALVLLLSVDYLRRAGVESGEYYALVLFATAGMMLLAAAGDLVVLFLALELMSLSLYVLAGLFTQVLASSEASMKYFILGAFASSFLLYGIALTYGATGTTNLDRIAAAVAGRSHDPIFVIGVGLLLVGFGFKIASVPFHMWAPDVYQGAPTSVTAFIATGSKAAAFAALIRVLTVALRGAQTDWTVLLWIVAALTMTVGNVAAIAQSNLKRMLAYSSIAHAGYMLVGLVAGGMSGVGAVLFYLLTYTFTTAGAFGVITLCERGRAEAVEVGDYAGLAGRHPVLAAALGLFLLSLIGVPPLAGFVGKFYVFGAAVRTGYPWNLWLTVIAVLNSAIAAYYYLRVVVYMYMREPEGAPVACAPSFAGGLALVVALIGIVALGVVPAPFVDLAQVAVAPLVR